MWNSHIQEVGVKKKTRKGEIFVSVDRKEEWEKQLWTIIEIYSGHTDEILLIRSISFKDIRLTQMQAANLMDSMHKQKPVGN